LEVLRLVGSAGSNEPVQADPVEPFWVLVSSGPGAVVRSGHRGTRSLHCNALTRKREAAWGEGDCGRETWRAIAIRRVSSSGKHPDSHEHVTLRGVARRCGSRLARWPEGSLRPFIVSESVTMDAQAASEEGNFQPPRSAASYCKAGRSAFALGCLAHVSSQSPLSCSVTLATGGGIVSSPASGVTRRVAFGALNFGELAAPRESAPMESTWLAARAAQKGCAACMPCSSKEVRGKREQTPEGLGQ